jgi:Ca2+-binding RTX toxin-like protein
MAIINVIGPTTFGTDETDVITGRVADDDIFALAGNDIVFGSGGEDLIDAGAGDDVVLGGPGNDLLLGREGNDFLFGQEGDDVLFADAGNDVLLGDIGNDDLFGGNGNDVIDGGPGADTLTGGPGSDLLIGGPIFDERIFGDIFQFNFGPGFIGLPAEPSQGNDVIQNFRLGVDDIRVAGLAEEAMFPGGDLDSNGDMRLDDDDARVDATLDGSLFVIDFNGVPLVDGGTAAGTLTLIGSSITSLEVTRDIFFV